MHHLQSHNLVSFRADDLLGRKRYVWRRDAVRYRKHLGDEQTVEEGEAEVLINCSKEVFPIKFDSCTVCQ